MNVKDLSLEKLESLAYNEVVKLGLVQKNLRILETEINERKNAPEVKPETKADSPITESKADGTETE